VLLSTPDFPETCDSSRLLTTRRFTELTIAGSTIAGSTIADTQFLVVSSVCFCWALPGKS
jgi:hypothetical protein